MDCSVAGSPVLHHLPEFFQIHFIGLVMLSNHLIFCCPLFLLHSASGSFPMSQLFTSGGQSTGASASVLPMNIQDWFPLQLISLICLQYRGLLRVFSSTTIQKHQFFNAQLSLWSNSHICTWQVEKPELWLYGPLSAEWWHSILIQCWIEMILKIYTGNTR